LSTPGDNTRFFGCGRETGNAKAAVPPLRGDPGTFSLEGERGACFGAENTGPGLVKTDSAGEAVASEGNPVTVARGVVEQCKEA
jgi:hypothetical protein